ncbi:MAG TPA: ABC transporter ATP-binding protein [Opitutaceae bacterium]|nr:ABC transporter ATP-binding protein [Opitutaceae bacterium]
MASSPKALLQLDYLTVKRGDVTILDRVSWRIQSGEHWVILGPNGCGKTSLLKTLLGYLSPTDGDLTLLNKEYGSNDWREVRLKLGIVTSALQASIPPAEPALETVISGRYAQLDLWVPFTPADERAGRNLLSLMGASHLEERPWLYLSQGERQRILIARAMMARPRVLILDEPCAGLDPVARAEFLAFVDLVGRQARGPALVLVTHHVEEITPVFTHALALRGGKVAAHGLLQEVVNSRVLSEVFGAPMEIRKSRNGRYSASVEV